MMRVRRVQSSTCIEHMCTLSQSALDPDHIFDKITILDRPRPGRRHDPTGRPEVSCAVREGRRRAGCVPACNWSYIVDYNYDF